MTRNTRHKHYSEIIELNGEYYLSQGFYNPDNPEEYLDRIDPIDELLECERNRVNVMLGEV